MKNGTLSTVDSCYPFTQVWSHRADLSVAYTIAAILEGILIIPTSIENFLVVAGIWKTRSLHTPANFLICLLAVSDLGVGIAILPFHIASNVFALKDDFAWWCDTTRIAYGLGVHFAAVSLITISAVSLERVVALYWALTYEIFATNNKLIAFLLLSWPSSALLSLLQYFEIYTYKMMATVISLVCFLASSVSCFKIYQVIHRHKTQIRHQESARKRREGWNSGDPEGARDLDKSRGTSLNRKTKSSLAMLLLYGLFVVCYTPYVCVQLAMLIGVENSFIQAAEILTVSIVFINSLLNPLLYCWRMRDIRRAMMSVVPFLSSWNSDISMVTQNLSVNQNRRTSYSTYK